MLTLEIANIKQSAKHSVTDMKPIEIIKEILEKKLNQGISISCDIRVVERYLKMAWDIIRRKK